jgi:hypothetical protein
LNRLISNTDPSIHHDRPTEEERRQTDQVFFIMSSSSSSISSVSSSVEVKTVDESQLADMKKQYETLLHKNGTVHFTSPIQQHDVQIDAWCGIEDILNMVESLQKWTSKHLDSSFQLQSESALPIIDANLHVVPRPYPLLNLTMMVSGMHLDRDVAMEFTSSATIVCGGAMTWPPFVLRTYSPASNKSATFSWFTSPASLCGSGCVIHCSSTAMLNCIDNTTFSHARFYSILIQPPESSMLLVKEEKSKA